MKNIMRFLPILGLALLLKFSACETENVTTIKKNLVETYKWPSTSTNVEVKSEPMVWIDSVTADTDST